MLDVTVQRHNATVYDAAQFYPEVTPENRNDKAVAVGVAIDWKQVLVLIADDENFWWTLGLETGDTFFEPYSQKPAMQGYCKPSQDLLGAVLQYDLQ